MDNATNNENAFWKARKADPRAQAYLPLVSNLTDATIEYLQQLGYDFKGEGAADSKHLPAEARRQVLCAASRVLNSYWQNLTINELIIGHLHYNNSWFGYDNRYVSRLHQTTTIRNNDIRTQVNNNEQLQHKSTTT